MPEIVLSTTVKMQHTEKSTFDARKIEHVLHFWFCSGIHGDISMMMLSRLRLKTPKLNKAGLCFILDCDFLQTEVHFLHLRDRDPFRRLHSRSFQQIMRLRHVNLNSKALAALQPVVTRVIAFHQISCPFPAVFHQQQGSPPPPNLPSLLCMSHSRAPSCPPGSAHTHTHV